MILLGDNLTGRRTLISKIINDDKDPYRGHGLSYEYINITGKDEEECGCLSFITVDPSAPIRAQERVCTSFISPQTIPAPYMNHIGYIKNPWYPSCKPLEKFTAAIPDAESLSDSLIVITLDFSKPWAVLESLQRWVREIKSHRDEWLRIPGIGRQHKNDPIHE